jgi:hypothetical protein
MGATVLGCGNSSQLFEATYLDGAPQVHIHFLTSEAEFRELGYGRLEFVCHSCGDAQLITYGLDHTQQDHVLLRDRFRDKHLKCENRDFEGNCPDYRRRIETVDLRHKTGRKVADRGTR